MKFSVSYFGGEDKNGHSCYIHSADCREKDRDHWEFQNEIEGDLQDAIDSYLDDELKSRGFDESIIKIYPCASAKEIKGE